MNYPRFSFKFSSELLYLTLRQNFGFAVCAFLSQNVRTGRQNAYSFLAPLWNLIVFTQFEFFSIWRILLILLYYKTGALLNGLTVLCLVECPTTECTSQNMLLPGGIAPAKDMGRWASWLLAEAAQCILCVSNNSRQLLLYNFYFSSDHLSKCKKFGIFCSCWDIAQL